MASRRTITGLSPQAEQVTQERMLAAAERRLQSAMAPELAHAYAAIANAHGNPGKQAEAIAKHGERVAEILTANWRSIWSQFGRRILSATQKSNGGFELKRDVPLTPIFDAAMIKWLQQFGSVKVTQIAGTTETQALAIINAAAAEAITAGVGEAATAKIIRERIAEKGGELSRLRSRVIARTEAHNASTSATQAAAEASEIPMKREWVASIGERARTIGGGAEFDHAAANGQIVGMHQPFIIQSDSGSEELMYPGDPSGSAGNVINCRCVVAYIPDL